MKNYKRPLIYPIMWVVAGLLFFLSALLQLKMGNSDAVLLNIGVTLLFLFDAYIYGRPYLGLGEGKLVVNNGLRRRLIAIENITSVNQSGKHLLLTYVQGSATKKQKIVLSMLNRLDKQEFINDIHSLSGK